MITQSFSGKQLETSFDSNRWVERGISIKESCAKIGKPIIFTKEILILHFKIQHTDKSSKKGSLRRGLGKTFRNSQESLTNFSVFSNEIWNQRVNSLTNSQFSNLSLRNYYFSYKKFLIELEHQYSIYKLIDYPNSEIVYNNKIEKYDNELYYY